LRSCFAGSLAAPSFMMFPGKCIGALELPARLVVPWWYATRMRGIPTWLQFQSCWHVVPCQERKRWTASRPAIDPDDEHRPAEGAPGKVTRSRRLTWRRARTREDARANIRDGHPVTLC
jgi:hypothetical protein